MTSKSHAISDVMDRMFALTVLYEGCDVHNSNGFGRDWHKFTQGRLTYMVVMRNGHLYTKYVPNERVQWFFDAYA